MIDEKIKRKCIKNMFFKYDRFSNTSAYVWFKVSDFNE